MSTRVRSVLAVFCFATLAALAVRLFLIEDYRIASGSMYPTLLPGDLVFVSKSDFNLRFPFSSFEIVSFRRPYRGEVVAFSLPDRAMDTFVKRVVAVEGDIVQITKGRLSINQTEAQYLMKDEAGTWVETIGAGEPHDVILDPDSGKDYGPVVVPKGHFFVLGDNRKESVDSRTWGPVPFSCLKGRVSMVWLSVAAGGKIRSERTGVKVHGGNAS